MLPESNVNLTELELNVQASKTYKLDLDKKRINGYVDNEDAIMQAVMKILNTERYAYVIYSSEYGVELERLIGADLDFVISDLKRTITEAILADDRMISITDFSIEKSGLNSLQTSFVVNSIFGSRHISLGVQIL